VPQALPDAPAAWGSFWLDVVPTSSKNSAVAWDFLNFLSSEDAQLFNASETSKFRPFGAPYSLVNLAPQLNSNPYLKPVLDTAKFAKSGEIADRSGNRKQVEALAKAVNAVLTGTSAEAALTQAKQEMTQ
jgi:ABC-type glycerol-3-phosphate transport system substrate-binding protein